MAKEKKDAPFNTPEVLARIHKATGQCQGIERMVKAGRPVESILLQISASRSALQRLGQTLLEQYIAQNISDSTDDKLVADATLKNIAQAVDYFCRSK
jgi:DNA-binding FrmR family transcriptional regulator